MKRPSQSRTLPVLLWLFAWLTFLTARTVEKQSIFISILKGLGFMAVGIVVASLMELLVLGPIPKEDDEDE